jgi:L-histidine N-alpha-methyltransferase
LLRRINRELHANFKLDQFAHRAFYNADHGRVEMHLVSRAAQTVKVANRPFVFTAGESIHTENSYKYDAEEFAGLVASAGFEPVQWWTDPQRRFGVFYFTRRAPVP